MSASKSLESLEIFRKTNHLVARLRLNIRNGQAFVSIILDMPPTLRYLHSICLICPDGTTTGRLLAETGELWTFEERTYNAEFDPLCLWNMAKDVSWSFPGDEQKGSDLLRK